MVLTITATVSIVRVEGEVQGCGEMDQHKASMTDVIFPDSEATVDHSLDPLNAGASQLQNRTGRKCVKSFSGRVLPFNPEVLTKDLTSTLSARQALCGQAQLLMSLCLAWKA